MYPYCNTVLLLYYIYYNRDRRITKKWQELLDMLNTRKATLSGFSNLMNMFREIESIQEELKEVEVLSLNLSDRLLIEISLFVISRISLTKMFFACFCNHFKQKLK